MRNLFVREKRAISLVGTFGQERRWSYLMDGHQIRQAEKVVYGFYSVMALATVLALIWYFIRGRL